MSEKMSVNISNSEISGGVLNGAVIGENNRVIHVAHNNDTDKFCDYLSYIILNSDSLEERQCASGAKIRYKRGEKSELKKFIIDNLATFSSGTFATLAGGALLEIIKGILA